MATKTFEELKQLAIQIRDEKTNKQNTATRVGTEMLEHLNKLEQDYYDKTTTDEELKKRDNKLTELENKIGSQTVEVDTELNEESQKPIANAPVTKGINKLKEQISTQLPAIEEAKENAIAEIGNKESDAIQNFSEQRVTPGMLSPETIQIINASGGGTINNLPDGETLAEIEMAEGLKAIGIPNRQPDTNLGYVILKKNKSLIEQITEANTIYEVRYAYDLGGETLTMPENCVLKFEGGIISNGTIDGSHTKIEANCGVKIFDRAISFSGSWDIPGGTYPEWFGVQTYKNINYSGEFVNRNSYPKEIDEYIDSSDSINNALLLASLSGSICYLCGGIYKTEKTIDIPTSATLYIDSLSMICPYMEGSGVDANGDKVYALAFDEYMPTSSMAIAVNANTGYTKIIGGGRICLLNSKYTIGLYFLGLTYHVTDMMFLPEIDIRIIGGCDGNTWAANSDDLIGEGTPDSTLGEDGDYYLDTAEMKIYKKSSESWSYARNGNCLYNTCFRIETPGNETKQDNRVVNTRFLIGAMYSFRGIEIINESPGWQNSLMYQGTVSNCTNSFLSIFAGPWYGDFSGMNFQIGANMNKDCKIIYSRSSSFVRYGHTWDLEYNDNAKKYPRYYFGENSTYNIIDVWSDDSSLYEDYGTNNVFLAKERFPSVLLTQPIDSLSWRNILQYRSPFSAIEGWGNDDGGIFQSEEIIDDDTLMSTLKSQSIKVDEESGIVSVPKLFYDCSMKTYYDVIDSSTSKKTAYFQIYCSAMYKLYPNNGSYFEFDYQIVNPSTNKAYSELPTKISCFYNFMTNADTVKIPLNIETDGDGFTGQQQLVNTVRLKFDRIYGIRLGFKFDEEPSEDSPIALRIYNIRILMDKEHSLVRNNLSSTTKNLPDACPKGFIIYDETLSKTAINVGDSSNIQWKYLQIEA